MLCNFPGGSVGKNLPVDAGDVHLIPVSGRSLEEEMATFLPLARTFCHPWQHSCQGDPMDTGVWRATVHGVVKSWTHLSHWTHAHTRKPMLCLWMLIARTDAEAEAPIRWPPDVKSWLIGKDPDAGKDWRQEEKGITEEEVVGWHHQLARHEFE